MTIYSFWVFDRHCNCIYNREWTQVVNPSSSTSASASSNTPTASLTGSINSKDNEDTAKLLFGTIFSLRNISNKLSPSSTTMTSANSLKSFATTNYRAHYYETASGLKFVAMSDLNVKDLQKELRFVYERIYVDCVVRNPLCPVDFKHQGKKITNGSFIHGIDRFFGTL
ncbi:hypothetical protein WICPIJ_001911 [Wickerhamomyces pijperi]|uniref:Trafficking protein particle complex subunit n=1 Tax=Wickerhamomyces pijperi TaxID=599730 RepID=A0A9P8TQC3_WICPI|nr:hypothetical protein WICPIJ_001911 [Wickerhamomyces pijperi]